MITEAMPKMEYTSTISGDYLGGISIFNLAAVVAVVIVLAIIIWHMSFPCGDRK